jgi:hypothetical protein
MSQANDSITVTPGTGATVATQLINGKEYQAVVIADGGSGQVAGSNPIYRLLIPSQAVGASKVYCDIFNATGSGKTIKVLSAFAYVDSDTAVTGTLGVQLDLFRSSTVGTGGTAATADGTVSTAATISKLDPSNASLPAGITARLAPTAGATVGAWLATRWVFTEETNASAGIAGTLGAEFIRNEGAEVIVPENTGLKFVQGTVASVGNVSFEITFEAY